MDAIPALQAAMYDPNGFILVGVLVVFGILALAAALTRGASIQVFPFQAHLPGDSVEGNSGAKKKPRHTGSWFTGDSLNRQAAVRQNEPPLEGLPATPRITLSWTGGDGVSHSSIYPVSGDFLNGGYDARIEILSEHLVAGPAGFRHRGGLLTPDLKAVAESGDLPKPVLWTYLRRRE